MLIYINCHLHTSHSLDRVLIGCISNSCSATFDLDVMYDVEEGSLSREQLTRFVCRMQGDGEGRQTES